MFGLKKKKKKEEAKNKVYYSVQGKFLCAWLSDSHKLSNKTTVPDLKKTCNEMFGKDQYVFINASTIKKGER